MGHMGIISGILIMFLTFTGWNIGILDAGMMIFLGIILLFAEDIVKNKSKLKKGEKLK